MSGAPRVLVLGAGQHARLVANILAQGESDAVVVGLLDDAPALLGKQVLGAPVVGPLAALEEHAPGASHFVLGIGCVGNPETLRLRRRRRRRGRRRRS